MVDAINDQNFDEETSNGVALVDFGQLGVVHVRCNHQ